MVRIGTTSWPNTWDQSVRLLPALHVIEKHEEDKIRRLPKRLITPKSPDSRRQAKQVVKQIYLNNSTLNRPFDDQGQARIKLETEALFQILSDIDSRRSKLILSEVSELENSKNPYYSVKIRIDELIAKAERRIRVNAGTKRQAKIFENAGLNGMDALHLAAAIQGKVDFFITCDDSFLRKARKATSDQTIRIMNPIEYILGEGL